MPEIVGKKSQINNDRYCIRWMRKRATEKKMQNFHFPWPMQLNLIWWQIKPIIDSIARARVCLCCVYEHFPTRRLSSIWLWIESVYAQIKNKNDDLCCSIFSPVSPFFSLVHSSLSLSRSLAHPNRRWVDLCSSLTIRCLFRFFSLPFSSSRSLTIRIKKIYFVLLFLALLLLEISS